MHFIDIQLCVNGVQDILDGGTSLCTDTDNHVSVNKLNDSCQAISMLARSFNHFVTIALQFNILEQNHKLKFYHESLNLKPILSSIFCK